MYLGNNLTVVDDFEIVNDLNLTVEFIEGRQWRSSDGEKESRC